MANKDKKMVLRDDRGNIYVVAYEYHKSKDGETWEVVDKLPKGFHHEFTYINPDDEN